ncbi:ribonuclease J [Candidatus Beckwithbacteria bacterium CG23_combo_of_CG06-09_8_20_14_all_34_8]|uniref:Ribonuclease J n=1 Tax=Candidatus Beckwithbacteria bacterium CG23_combo_of_CG06-09_8_20_14_all_34_8 TaxID=1974497 RepID=A0A2H0B6H1_9BACT|nr:MAG: ribonuclease J [Candidatus Beckwithbacteria bacterium CG23_combo_of_CG06-09_8_20_14_all_34_8]
MLRIVPLGGMGKVTKNIFVYELLGHGPDQRLIVDCGMGFPEEEMLGADLLVPDVSYLMDKLDTIVGMILTHGHDDHIGALPYILPQLNKDFPIFASPLTAGFAQENLEEFGIKTKINLFPKELLQLGNFTIDPITVTHSVPDTKHLAIITPDGIYYHGSDFKFDWTPVDHIRPDVVKIAEYGRKGIKAILLDCLRVEKEGYSWSETKVGESLIREIREVTGKVVITTMSSNIHRIQQAIDAAVLHHRKVVFIGRSVEENCKVAQGLGLLKIPENVVVNKKRIKNMEDKQLCLIVAGSQGQIGSTLTRIANNEHSMVSVKEGDHIVFSADPIPGNEGNVYKTIDSLSKLGATVSYSDIQDDLHVSGHASADELRLMLTLSNPKSIVPIGGTYRHMVHFKNLASGMGWSNDQIHILDDGQIIAFDQRGGWVDNVIKLKTVIVDGLGVGDVGPVVLQDRQKMAHSGMIIVAVPAKKEGNEVIGRPEVITRGFVFARKSQELIESIADEAAKWLPVGMKVNDWKATRDEVNEKISHFVFEQTQREPLILVTLVWS